MRDVIWKTIWDAVGGKVIVLYNCLKIEDIAVYVFKDSQYYTFGGWTLFQECSLSHS